jgi:hypothetical protein
LDYQDLQISSPGLPLDQHIVSNVSPPQTNHRITVSLSHKHKLSFEITVLSINALAFFKPAKTAAYGYPYKRLLARNAGGVLEPLLQWPLSAVIAEYG